MVGRAVSDLHARLSTGIDGLDSVLGGGLFPGSSVLVRGAPGTGKTTLAIQFLCEGARRGEGGAYFSFEEFPEQIYRDAGELGFDLPALEQAGKLQVITMEPGAFLEEALEPGGLLEELRRDIGLRRVAVDSVTLLELALSGRGDSRRTLYLLRNALHRLGLTTLLIEEGAPAEGPSMAEYMVDTVLHLTYDDFEVNRLRHLEVRKHRGSPFRSGKHVFVIVRQGIRVLPALDRVPDLTVGQVVPTGLDRLDECLGGGIPRGSTFALNVNSKCNYRYLLGAIAAAHLQQGDGYVAARSAVRPPAVVAMVLGLYSFDAARLGAEGRWRYVEQVGRPVPPELEPYIIRVSNEFDLFVEPGSQTALAHGIGAPDGPKHWLWSLDLNTAMHTLKQDAVVKGWAEAIAYARYRGDTILGICNFEEMGPAMSAFVQRNAEGILRTWFDGRYQYLQVQKAPNGRVSEPMVIEYTDTPPYLLLW